jgi:hypothetical protein
MNLLSSVPHTDVLRSIVVRVHFVPALLALEVLSVAVVFVREPTIHSRTALTRIVRLNLLHEDTLLRRFVLNVLEQASKRSNMMPLRMGKPLSNVG